MLGSRGGGGYSKTARSHRHPRPRGRHLEAAGRHHRPMPHADLPRHLRTLVRSGQGG